MMGTCDLGQSQVPISKKPLKSPDFCLPKSSTSSVSIDCKSHFSRVKKVDITAACGKMGNLFARYKSSWNSAIDSFRYIGKEDESPVAIDEEKVTIAINEDYEQQLDATELLLHRKLFDFSAEKRNLHVEECFMPLSEAEKAEVSSALSKSNTRNILVSHENSNIDITGEILRCLSPRAWLNDEVINLYLELLKEREKREPRKFLKCHFFNTFFYKRLIGKGGYDFQSVRRWTSQRKLGYSLLECDRIFVPIHKETHWCLAIIDTKNEKFQYLDSLGGGDTQVMKVLSRYFVDEVKDKSGIDIDVSSWEQEFIEDLPKQKNIFDCGMFMIKYADFYSRDIPLCFTQKNMAYFRRRTAKEILRLRAE